MADANYLSLIFKKRDTVVMVLVVFISLLISRTVYQQQMQKVAHLKEEIKREKEKSESINRIVIINEKLKKIKEKSWDTVDANILVERIFNIGLESQVKIRTMAPENKSDQNNYVLIPFSIACDATYKDLVNFTKRLETHPMFIRIREMSASPMGEPAADKKDIVLRINLRIEAVYLK